MTWIEAPPLPLENGKIRFDTNLCSKVAIKVLVSEKPSWDFGGWLFPVFTTPIGEIEGAWRKLYLKKRQIVTIDFKELSGEFQINFEPVSWLVQFEITLFYWQPVDLVKSEIIDLPPGQQQEVLSLNVNRKDYLLGNIGQSPIAYSWGNTLPTLLNIGEVIEESNTTNKQPLVVTNNSEAATIIKIMERSEV